MLLTSRDYVGKDRSVKVIKRSPQPDFPEHRHEFSELVLISSGYGSHIVQGESTLVLPNTVLNVPDSTFHQYDENKNLSLVNILYDKKSVGLSVAGAEVIKRLETSASQQILPHKTIEQLTALTSQMAKEQESDQLYSGQMLELLFEQCLLLLARSFTGATPGSPTLCAIQFIHNEFSNPELSIVAVCEQFQVTQKTLNTKLQQMTGLTVNKFINLLRIRKAQQLLRQDWSVTDTAMAVGYNDSNYFSSKFKSVTGQTARAFTQAHSA